MLDKNKTEEKSKVGNRKRGKSSTNKSTIIAYIKLAGER